MATPIRIGAGSAYADDNLTPALDLARSGAVDVLCFDGLAERTLALAQLRRLEQTGAGYDRRLDRFGRDFLPHAARGLTLVTNMGAADPLAAGERLRQIADAAGYRDLGIAVVLGDDVLAVVRALDPVIEETGEPLSRLGGRLVSANAYLGAEPIAAALEQGARVVIGGRLADPSLFLAPLMVRYGWSASDWPRLGQGTVVGHLLECGTQVTGGNFADPPYRVVPRLDDLAMPIAEVEPDGRAVLTKLSGTGGMVTPDTVKAQLVYEILDPGAYLTPDVTADFRAVTVAAAGPDRVRVEGGTGRARPERLKVLVGVHEGFQGEGEVSFAGPGAYDRARLCRDVLRARYERYYARDCVDMRLDLIGVDSLHGPVAPLPRHEPYEVRVRLAVRSPEREVAEAVSREVEWQYLGPAGAGGIRLRVTPVLALYTTYLERAAVPVEVVAV
ncbi:MAG: DUF1446 domain-containing protein [Actinomycetia bacterium]|nr:DUF1446 domain-containing protein [Actinomycetes bacterium]